MANPKSANNEPLRVRVDCSDLLVDRVAWALEALMARAKVRSWILVRGTSLGDAPADLQLAHAGSAWMFQQDQPPSKDVDPLAFTFWWLARIEEQLAPHECFDEHGRFSYAASYAARTKTPLATPVDDLALSLEIDPHFRDAEDWRPGTSWSVVATHDIDLPWRWYSRGRRIALRRIRAALRAHDWSAATRTTLALLAAPFWRLRESDPWNNAEQIMRLERRYDARSTNYMMLDAVVPADGDPEMHDRGGPRYIESLISSRRRRTLGTWRVGLHSSYTAHTNPERVANESAMLERKLGEPVEDHRYHYLRHRPVEAWPVLANAKLRSDASLGWAEQPGFRAGTAHPFRAWSHEDNKALELIIIPLAFMDASLDARYLNLDPNTSGREAAIEVLSAVKRVGGSSSILFHNDRLCCIDSTSWTRLYKHMLRWIQFEDGAAIPARDAAVSYRMRIAGAWSAQPR